MSKIKHKTWPETISRGNTHKALLSSLDRLIAKTDTEEFRWFISVLLKEKENHPDNQTN